MSEKRSRVNRYASLREELLHENQQNIVTKELSTFANQLHAIDNEQFEEMKLETSTDYHSPLRSRNSYYNYEKEISHTLVDQTEKTNESEEDPTTFKTNYIDEVIKEVKQYNVEKGYRKEDDTKSNLLFELKQKNQTLRPFGNIHYISEEPALNEEPKVELEEEILETFDSIIPDTSELSKQDDFDTDLVSEIDPIEIPTPVIDETIMMKVAQYANDENQDYLEEEEIVVKSDIVSKPLLNESNSSNLEVHKTTDKSNLLINTILVILSIAIIIIMLFIGYMLLKLNKVI